MFTKVSALKEFRSLSQLIYQNVFGGWKETYANTEKTCKLHANSVLAGFKTQVPNAARQKYYTKTLCCHSHYLLLDCHAEAENLSQGTGT